jgi:hypothetical protein
VNLYNYHTDKKTLKGYDNKDELIPTEVWDKFKNQPDELKKREHVLARNAKTAYKYAVYVLDGRFKLGEPALSKNSQYAMSYAQFLNGFPAAETLFANNAIDALTYSTDVIKKPFPLGEPAIADIMSTASRYLQVFPERKTAIENLRTKSGKKSYFH